MIIFHFHLQPQFKYELLHIIILHNNKKNVELQAERKFVRLNGGHCLKATLYNPQTYVTSKMLFALLKCCIIVQTIDVIPRILVKELLYFSEIPMICFVLFQFKISY